MMHSKDLIIKVTEDSCDMFWRFARAVPSERVLWKASEDSRTALELCQECAQAPKWSEGMLRIRAIPDDLGDWQAILSEREGWTTVEACEAESRSRTESLIAAIREFPESAMEQTLFLPFTGKDHPFWDIMMYPHWNFTWHTGQVAYLQTMWGDKDMH